MSSFTPLQRKTENEFVWLKPTVLSKIRSGLQERNAQPKPVCEHEMLPNGSSDRPRDHKHVRNVAQALAGESGHRKKFVNFADDVHSLLTSVQTCFCEGSKCESWDVSCNTVLHR